MADLVTVDQVLAHLNLTENPPADLSELELFIDAATAHVAHHYGVMPSGTYTETVTVFDDGVGAYRYWVRPRRFPVTSVTSAVLEDGSLSYSTDFSVDPDGRLVRHPSLAAGEWTLTYVAGSAVPADLQLAVLEDIRGLYQPGQIGPPASFGSFNIEGEDRTFRPVTMWPRVDAWLNARLGTTQIA